MSTGTSGENHSADVPPRVDRPLREPPGGANRAPLSESHRLAQGCAGAAFAVALLAETGWLFHVRSLTGAWGHYFPMAPVSAVAVLLLSSGVFIRSRWRAHPMSQPLALTVAGLVTLLGLLILARFIAGFDSGVEWVLSRSAAPGWTPVSRMSPLTAGMLVLEGAALMLLTGAGRWRRASTGAAALALLGTVASLVVLVGYAYGAPLMYGASTIPVSLPTGLAFVFMGVGLIGMAAPGVPALDAWSGDSIRGLLLRAFLPAILAIILLEGCLDAFQPAAAPLNPALWHSIAAMVAGAVVVVIIGWTARRTGGALDDAVETLRGSEERFRRMFQHSAAGMVLVSPGLRFLQVNPTFCKLLGYAESELLGKTFQDFTFPEDRPVGAAQVRRVLAGEAEMFHFEKRYLRKDGTVVWGLVSSTLIRDSQGKPLHFVTQIQDITEGKRAEDALRASEERYRELFDSSSDALFLLDTATDRILETNALASELYGYSRDEMRARKATDMSAEPEDTHQRVQETQTLPGSVFRIPLRFHRKKDGTVFPVEISARTFLRQERVLLLVASRDITERRRAEEALRASEEQHRTVIETAMDGFWLTDGQGHLLQVNNAYCRMTGYSMAELLSMSISEVEAAETANETAVHVRGIMARGEDRFETRHRRKDGSVFEVEVSAQYWAIEGGRLVVFLRDITQRKRDEETLRNNEMRLRAVLDATPFPIALVDIEDNVIDFWSRSALELFGHTALTAAAWYELAYPDPEYRREVIERWKPALEKARLSGQAVNSGEYRISCHDGSVRICELYAAFLADKLVVTFNDITSRKQAEEQSGLLQDRLAQAQKMESVGRLAGGVAHDFNNLLTVINGFAAFLADQLPAGSRPRGYALEIAKAGDRAASLTSQLLAFSRKQVVQPRPTNLNGVIADAEGILRRLIGEDVELAVAPAPRVGLVMVDPGQMHQVVMNLAVNARDAMPNGGRLEIATAEAEVSDTAAGNPDAAPGRYVRLTVSDTGMGMTEEVRRNVFEPFFTTKERGKGTGLGLATVYGIVRQNGGWIEVESQPGRGSTFQIYLPCAAAGAVAEDAGPEVANPSRGNETVLIVEDQEGVRSLARTILAERGYRVLEACDGAEALAIADSRTGRIDLLLTDVVMPGMDGRVLSEHLRELLPDLRVILMSGYAEDVMANRGILAGSSVYVQKPFSPGDLAAKVREVLDAPARSRLEP